jgi:DNA-binding PucR family transcriptional regulator
MAGDLQPTLTLDAEEQADARVVLGELAGTSMHIGADMATHLHARIPELAGMPDEHALIGATEASCSANVEQILTLLARGTRPEELVVPEPAEEYAQGLVQRRVPLAVLLRAYRLGHGFFWNITADTLKREIDNEAVLVSSLEASSNFLFEYIDTVSGKLVTAYQLERDRWVRSAAAVRAETARRIIDGKLDDERAGSSRLGYELRRSHVGLILTGEPANRGAGGGSLEKEAIEAAAILGCADPLLVPAGVGVLWAWCGTFKPPLPQALAQVEQHAPPEGVRMAVGRPAHGIEGFRVTHLEAGHAARFWDIGAVPLGGTTSYRAVEVVSLLATDLPRARRFVINELGPLAEQSDANARMRSTLLGFLAHGGSHVRAAQALHMHQNTVYNRVRRAEELLGGPVTERRVELQTALMLAETLGDEVLH